MALSVMAIGMVGIGIAAFGHLSSGHGLPTRGSLHAPSPKGKTRKMISFKREEEINLIQMDGEAKTPITRPGRDEKGDSKYRKDNKFLLGVVCAVFVGVSNGRFLIPFKYATKVGDLLRRKQKVVACFLCWPSVFVSETSLFLTQD